MVLPVRSVQAIAANVEALLAVLEFEIQMFKIYSYGNRLTKAGTKVQRFI